MSYFVIEGEVLHSTRELSLQKSQAISAAIKISKHWDWIEARCVIDAETKSLRSEIIIAELSWDPIPSRNKHGIQYCERLAIVIDALGTKIPEVLAIRKSFPIVGHLNSTSANNPKSLCLYFETPDAVSRTWTAEKHLGRIVWWMESTALNTLHASDQPVEQLFFVSPWELVLPSDALESFGEIQQNLVIERIEKRKQGCTYISDWEDKEKNSQLKASILIVDCKPIIHGHIEMMPSSFNELSKVLLSRGVDFPSYLTKQIYNRVDEKGSPPLPENLPTIIVLKSPICRRDGDPVERVQYTAYLSKLNYLEIGVKCDRLFELDGRFYRFAHAGERTSSANLEDFSLESVNVLFKTSPKDRRIQSGTKSVGPRGVLIGVGALGGFLIELWVRCGWGEWLLIDKDHIKPHNLTRHPALGHQIGREKSKAIHESSHWNFGKDVGVSSLVFDALKVEADEMKSGFEGKELVIDISTTLEYPRLVSKMDSVPRHISIFVTPDGLSCVMFIEDKDRSIRLNTIEAQYYRAIINCAWAEEHLSGRSKSYWTGGSCRDISFALSYSRITSFGSLLSEQVQFRVGNDEAYAVVWIDNSNNGERKAHKIPVYPQKIYKIDGMEIFIDDGLIKKLENMRNECLPMETGGILVGYHDFNCSSVFIVDALAAPSDSRLSVNHFERGIIGVNELINNIRQKTLDVVDYIGEWHSHPRNITSNPSGDDIIQLCDLSSKMSLDGLPAYSLIVGEGGINILQGKMSNDY